MDMGLEKLTKTVLQMAELSEKSVATSIEGYSEGKNLSEQIYEWSEELRKLQEEVSDLAIELFARYQPVASDLRYIKACMEISYGFSRFGRYAYDIAEVLQMFGDLSECDHALVEKTAITTKEMIRKSIDAFSKRDVELAKSVRQMDDIVDNNYREHVSKMIREPKLDIKCVASTTLILRYLERIADHASYIGDSVIFIATRKHAGA